MSEHPPCKLDSTVTTGIPPQRSSYRAFKGLRHKVELDAATRLYSFLDDDSARSRLDNFESCGHGAWFARHEESGEVRVVSQACHLRWCPMCASGRQYRIAEAVKPWIQKASYPKMLTLTMRHNDEELGDQITYLYDCFRGLRKLKYFRDRVLGGVWFFQIKLSKNDGLWHPHLHCLLEGKWVNQNRISKLWLQQTGDSPIVDVRLVKDVDQASEYVARYAAKPSLLSELDLSKSYILYTALKGRRLIGTWGTARSLSFRAVRPADCDDWSRVGSWWEVLNNLETDDGAKQIMAAWKLNQPLQAGVSVGYLENNTFRLDKFKRHIVQTPYFTGFWQLKPLTRFTEAQK